MAEAIKRAARFISALALVAALAGCYKYVFLPGEVKYETVSPPYVVQLANRTGRPFTVEPSEFGRYKKFSGQLVPDGGSFDLLMQIRKFRVTESDITGAQQIMDAPYIEQEGGNSAVIRVRHAELSTQTIDLDSARWLAPRESTTAQPAPLIIELRDFAPRRWFLNGPP